MKDIIIVGAGGFGREVESMLWDCFSRNEYRLKGFLSRDATDLDGYSVNAVHLGAPEEYAPQTEDRFVLAIGAMAARRRNVEALIAKGALFLNMIHPTATIFSSAVLGRGLVVYPHATVSNCAKLEDYVHLSLYASVGHDGHIGRLSLLSPYVTVNGFGFVADEVFMGSHATIGPGTRVGQQCVVSANTSVLKDVPDQYFVFGSPGRQTARIDIEIPTANNMNI